MKFHGTTIEPDRLYTAPGMGRNLPPLQDACERQVPPRGTRLCQVWPVRYYRGSDLISHLEAQRRPTGPDAALEHAEDLARRAAPDVKPETKRRSSPV